MLLYYCEISHKSWNNIVEYFNKKIENNIDFKVNVNKYGVEYFDEKDLELLLDAKYYNLKSNNRMLRQVIIRYSDAWNRCYNKINNANPPKFHKYNPKKQSFGLVSQTCSISKFKISIPYAKGTCAEFKNLGIYDKKIQIDKEYLLKRDIKKVINPTYAYHNGKWYLSGSYKKTLEVENSGEYLGLDWGIENFLTDNLGNKYNYPSSVVRQFYRINKLKSYLSKKEKRSNNWNRLSNKLDFAWERLDNLKTNYIHQTTSILSNYNIAVEDLTNAKILKSHKNRRRLQLVSPRSDFFDKLEYKCNWKGNYFIKVNPKNTSRTCSKCGLIKNRIPTSIRVFECECGFRIDRDINAGINILARGYC